MAEQPKSPSTKQEVEEAPRDEPEGFSIEWPTGKERVFAEPGLHGNAAVRVWGMSLEGYANAYRSAAETLYEARSGKTDNYQLFPLGFLWRHYVELSLKYITTLIPGSNGYDPDDFKDIHNLLRLWHPIEAFANNPASEDIAAATQILTKLDQVDSDGYGFRYPVKVAKAGRAPYLTEAPTVVDIDEFHLSMVRLGNLLDGMAAKYWAERDAMPHDDWDGGPGDDGPWGEDF